MKIIRIEIQNFRTIHKIKFNPSDYTLLVGANNAGKTTIIDALRIFYEHEGYKYIDERDKPHNLDSEKEIESWIELGFSLTAEEEKFLPKSYKHSKREITLRKWLAHAPSDYINNYIYKYNDIGKLERSNFFSMAEIKKGRLGKLIYVPAISSIDQYTKLSSASSLRDILEVLLSSITSNSDSFKQMHKSFKDFSENMTQYEHTSEVTLKKFTNQISTELKPWGVGFKIDFIPPDLKFIVKNLIDWRLFDSDKDEKEHGVEMYGSGFQRHFIASLIKTIAGFQHSLTQQESQELKLNLTLFLFEEPEAYLHPPQQIKLAKDLYDLTNGTIMQVIASTHSSHFVSRNTDKLTNLVRVRRDRLYTEVYQIDNDKKDKIFSALQQLEKILGKNEFLSEEDKLIIEGIKYFLWLDNERTTIFFSNLVLLVEGLTEAALFRRLIDDGLLDLPAGCGVIQSEGKFNTTRFMLLLEALGIDFITIYDEDSDKKVKHKKLNELIKETHGNNKFSKGLVDIIPDLETYLEWPKLENKSGAHKPAHAILNYEKKRGNFERLTNLCKRIESIITKDSAI